ncbi:hypothetical protein [Butyricicoccus sp. Marseille-Q5471]|uniref:hypothetical protein n=1 Tax=Butyricicoccus sp. Marseille-Q5471 TaxID=3039493 RepID=UPI0024BC23B5|nr:hypothetical protein [Butyricicoccus sp. Marseille-Q5471]
MGKKMQPVSSLTFDAFIAKKEGLSYGEYSSRTSGTERRELEERYWKEFRKAMKRAHATPEKDSDAGQKETGR